MMPKVSTDRPIARRRKSLLWRVNQRPVALSTNQIASWTATPPSVDGSRKSSNQDPDAAMRSPARIGTVSQFSAGGNAHE